ncbi:hypothetical protein C4D60_Mb04t12110 [Musa balbisiana]|uniref:Uncharacterized protein n=1 Tax=Musa balbisiana TaxID=52838 RepID=A0A4S8KBG9_MUSBA|nr:hypothetical protein C4D60_Mb04t12110 [Musa balbisiana]
MRGRNGEAAGERGGPQTAAESSVEEKGGDSIEWLGTSIPESTTHTELLRARDPIDRRSRRFRPHEIKLTFQSLFLQPQA